MVFFRWFVGLPVAAIVTAGLFAMMAGFINSERGPLPNPADHPQIKITPEERDPQPGPDKPPRPDLLDEPPDVDIPPADRQDIPGPVIDTTPGTPTGPKPGTKGGQFPTPVIKHAPLYPENCRSYNAEGYVTVQFDVTPEGNVVNARIVESADRCFNRTVIATVSKWKYPPAYQGDRPVMRYGVVEVFNFQLEE